MTKTVEARETAETQGAAGAVGSASAENTTAAGGLGDQAVPGGLGDQAVPGGLGDQAIPGGFCYQAIPGGFCYQAIPGGELDAIRAEGRDEAGNPLKVQVYRDGGAPLRCCLREARAGERLLLIAYTPPGTAGAYAERGPVFVHAERCAGYLMPGEYPPELAGRQQVVRAYDKQGRIADGVLVADGRQAQAAIAELLARPEVELVHLRNVGYGCYNFAVRANG